jgi:hypothetical protein
MVAVRVTIEARNKQSAEIVARHLGADASPRSRRGFGVIRMVAKNAAETAGIVERVSGLLEEQRNLGWVRVRYDDESRVFRSNGRKPA